MQSKFHVAHIPFCPLLRRYACLRALNASSLFSAFSAWDYDPLFPLSPLGGLAGPGLVIADGRIVPAQGFYAALRSGAVLDVPLLVQSMMAEDDFFVNPDVEQPGFNVTAFIVGPQFAKMWPSAGLAEIARLYAPGAGIDDANRYMSMRACV